MSQQLLVECLSQILESIVPAHLTPDQKSAVLTQLLAYSEQIQIQPNPKYNLNEVINSLERFFTSQKNWQQFEENVKILLNYNSPHYVAELLMFFNSLSNGQISISTTTTTNNEDYISQQQYRLDSLRNNSLIYSNNDRRGASQSSSSSNFQDLGNEQKRQRANFSNFDLKKQSIYEIVEELYQEFNPDYITESQMLEVIYYTLLGTTSELFPIDKSLNTISLPNSISNGHSNMLHLIFEASLLYKYLLNVIKKHQHASQIKIAFLSQVNLILQNYITIINELSINNLNENLIEIYQTVLNEIYKFRYLYFLIKKIDTISGDQLLTILFEFLKFGDPLIKNMTKELFRISSEPYFKILENWIINGELLNDINKEFFIYVDNQNGNGDNESIGNMKLDKSKYPNFLSLKSREKIYQIGKMIIFLKINCKEFNFLNNYNLKFKRNFGKININDNNQLIMLIDSQYLELTNYLTYLLYNNYEFDERLGNLKKLLLCSKGDFIESLLLNSDGVLNEPSQFLSSIEISKILYKSIETSSFKNYSQEVLSRLDGRILSLNTSGGNLGWDVFTLDFKLEKSLSLIIYNDNFGNLKSYLKLFNFLFKFRKINYMLEKSWKNSNLISKKFFKKIDTEDIEKLKLIKKFNNLNIYKNLFLNSFLKKLLSHLNLEIIEKEFDKLFDKLNKSSTLLTNRILLPNENYLNSINEQIFIKNNIPKPTILNNKFENYSIDEFIDIHKDYLTRISNHKLFSSTNKSSVGLKSQKYFIYQINSLLSLIESFLESEKEFNNLLINDILKENLDNHKINKNYRYLKEIFQEFETRKNLLADDFYNDNDLQTLNL